MPPEERPSGGFGGAIAAANQRAQRSLLRNHGGGHAAVSFLELFFDLVFVFAITQLSHFLKDHLSWLGFTQALVMFLAVWWAWMYTTWATNWADPDRLEVRIMLITLMALSLVMAVALPYGFSKYAGLFAASYVVLQLGRTLFMAAILQVGSPANARNMLRISLWFVASGVFWAIGALRGEDERIGWWAAALMIEYLGPIALYRVPFYGRSSPTDWNISGSHMAERCGLFIIIALGEGIIITGASFAELSMETGRVQAFILAFLSSVLMWWLYFDLGEKRGSQFIRDHAEAGRIGRSAYTYLHMPIVLGIVVFAVADAKLLADWAAPASGKLIMVFCGGAILFLNGLAFFKRFSNSMGNFPLSHGVGSLLFMVLGIFAWARPITSLQLAGIGVSSFAMVAAWEWVSYHGGWQERINDLRGWVRLARRY